jgi:hypothetical protein
MAKDQEYPARFASAWERVIDNVESEAIRRAYESVLEAVFYNCRRALDIQVDEKGEIVRDSQGKPVAVPASTRRFSDRLLVHLLSANKSNNRQRQDTRFVDDAGKDAAGHRGGAGLDAEHLGPRATTSQRA